MSCRNLSISETKLAEIISSVREVAQSYRRMGLKGDHVIAQASADLGITERRVKTYIYDGVYSITHAEVELIEAGFILFLDREAARLTARAAVVIARRAALSSPPATQTSAPKRPARLRVVSPPGR